MDHPWEFNEHGYWCPSCGELVGRWEDDPEDLPDECRACGFPEDAEKMAEYFGE